MQNSFAGSAKSRPLEKDTLPKYALAYNGKGLVSSSRKDYKEAIAFYEQAIQLDSNCALAYANRGFSLRRDKEREENNCQMEPHEIEAREKEIHKAFEDAVAAYNRLLQTEEKAIWYHHQVTALQQLGPKRSSEAKKAEKRVAYRLLRVGFAEQLRRLCEISTLRERYVTEKRARELGYKKKELGYEKKELGHEKKGIIAKAREIFTPPF